MLATENFAEWIFQTHADKFDKSAVVDDHNVLTYGQLKNKVELFAGFLHARGHQPQQRIIISMDDCVAWPVVFLGALYIGMNPVLVSGVMLPIDIERVIDLSDAVVIVSDHVQDWSIPCIDKKIVMSCQAVPFKDFYRYHPDEMCLWLLSSGSTGESKCIVNRHANLYNLLQLVSDTLGINSTSAVLSTAKMSWTYGFNVSITFALGLGATAYVISGVPAPSRITQRINNSNITHLFTVPGVLISILKHNSDLDDLNCNVFSAGESLPSYVAQEFLNRYKIQICDMYGLGETTQVCIMQTRDNWQIGSIGQPLPGIQYKLCDELGNLVKIGHVGELWIASPCQASFYWKDHERTQQIFQGSWVRTGDQCYQLDHNNLVFMGRCDDLIKINGLTVAPSEIENAIMNLNLVEDCTVVHTTNVQGLAELHAFVITLGDTDSNHIQQQLQQYLPVYKIPRHIKFVDSLPKTLTNKKIRNTLRKNLV